MKGIIFNTELNAKELNDKLTLSVKSLFDKKTTNYSYVKKHPLKELYCVVIDDNGKYWTEINKQTVNNTIEVLPKDWINKLEI